MLKFLKPRSLFRGFIILGILFLLLTVGAMTYIKSGVIPEIEDLETIEFYSDDDTKFLELNNSQKKNWVTLEDISPNLVNAILCVEDKSFYEHSGFDVKRLLKSMFDNIRTSSKSYGASTITQQYAKNLYLSNEKTWSRKIKEAYYTILLEQNYTKDEILEGYLNTIYFGHGIYGIEDASIYYFGKHANELNNAESAVLAAIPKSPSYYYSPILNPEKNKERQEVILKLMMDQQIINKEEYTEAIDYEISIVGVHPQNNTDFAPYYQDIVIDELERLEIFNSNFYQGLKVYTTLDMDLHKIAKNNIDTIISKDSDIEIALYAIEPSTGYVKTVIGGRDYENSQYNRAISGARQPGSTMKPILYYSALEYGFTPVTTFNSSPTTFYVDNSEEPYQPTNFADVYAYKDITMAYALAVSDNMYAVKTHLFLGPSTLVTIANRLGIESEMDANPSLALGASEIKLSEMTTAYAHFANYGKKVTPTFITKVTDTEGNVLYETETPDEQVLDPDLSFIMNDMLKGMFDARLSEHISVTGLSITHSLNRTYAGKSGSTDYDSWMIGYNPEITIGVWAGFDELEPIEELSDQKYPKLIWSSVIEDYMDSKTPNDVWFAPTSGVVAVIVDPINGGLANESTRYSKPLYFKKGSEPQSIFQNDFLND